MSRFDPEFIELYDKYNGKPFHVTTFYTLIEYNSDNITYILKLNKYISKKGIKNFTLESLFSKIANYFENEISERNSEVELTQNDIIKLVRETIVLCGLYFDFSEDSKEDLSADKKRVSKDYSKYKSEIQKSSMMITNHKIKLEAETDLKIFESYKELLGLLSNNKGLSILYYQKVKNYIDSINKWLNIPNFRIHVFIKEIYIDLGFLEDDKNNDIYFSSLPRNINRIDKKKLSRIEELSRLLFTNISLKDT